jgi:hypothetical protein
MVRFGLALAAAILATGTAAMADGTTGLPNTSVDWSQEFCLTDCTATMTSSPITQIDLIMATPGVTFTGVGPVYTNEGESTVDSNASTTLGTTESAINFSSPDSNDLFLNLNFSPISTSTPFTFYWEQWDGSTFITTGSSITSSDMVSWNGSSWTITPMAAAVNMPEPGILLQLALSLGLLGGLLFVRRRALA